MSSQEDFEIESSSSSESDFEIDDCDFNDYELNYQEEQHIWEAFDREFARAFGPNDET